MRVLIELYTQEKISYTQELLLEVANETLNRSGLVFCDTLEKINLSVAVVESQEIKRVNKKLRNKNQVTDVISVGDYSDNRDITKECGQEIFLGEVILCYNFIQQSALEKGVDVDEEFFTVYSHGILHLLGFEHGKVMFEIQDAISKNFCYNK
jgi:probable rRNA maturation factor